MQPIEKADAASLLRILEAGKKDHQIVWQQASEPLKYFEDQMKSLTMAVYSMSVTLDPKAAVVLGGSVA